MNKASRIILARQLIYCAKMVLDAGQFKGNKNMNRIDRIALKIAREYFADNEQQPYSYEQIDDLQIQDSDVSPLIQQCINSQLYKEQKIYSGQYNLSALISDLSQKFNIKSDSKHNIFIFYIPKNYNQIMPSDINPQLKIQINHFCNSNGLGMTSIDGKRIYIGTIIFTQDGKQFIVDSDHLKKTLRHELQHSCSIKLGAKKDKIVNTIENSEAEKDIIEFAKRDEIGRYKNDMISDIKRYNIDPNLFISFIQNHKQQNCQQILKSATKESMQYIRNNNKSRLLNTDIGNSMIFMYAIYKYNHPWYQRVISCLQKLK